MVASYLPPCAESSGQGCQLAELTGPGFTFVQSKSRTDESDESKINLIQFFVVFSGPVTIVFGERVSTSHEIDFVEMLPARFLARTVNLWSPLLNDESVCGETQAEYEPPSSLHSNVDPTSSAEKAKVALVLLENGDG